MKTMGRKNEKSEGDEGKAAVSDETYLQQRGQEAGTKAGDPLSKRQLFPGPALSWAGMKRKESRLKKIATSSTREYLFNLHRCSKTG